MNAFLTQAPVAWYVARAAGLVAFGAAHPVGLARARR